jgi:hypothetical protein
LRHLRFVSVIDVKPLIAYAHDAFFEEQHFRVPKGRRWPMSFIRRRFVFFGRLVLE